MEQLIDEDPKKFFEFVNTSKKSSADLPNEMEYRNRKVHNKYGIANLFAEHFANSYTGPNGIISDNYYDNDPHLRDICANIPTINITEDMVSEKINELPGNLVSGPDGIPNIFIKNTIVSLLKPITHLLNRSLQSGFVPNIWKQSFVRPIHKSGVKNKIENYRGVAIQCIIPKLLDSIVANHLNIHIRNIIDESQHGFVKGKSTVTNLAEFASEALCNMENSIQTDAINVDLEKAFDSPNIDLLVEKLNVMGLNWQLLNWIASYLQNREQIVKLNDAMSIPIKVTSGTGQGYPIGATLFLLFIVDLPKCIVSSKLQSFADDTRISKPIADINDCQKLQDDLNRLVEYIEHNNLKLNVKKTNYITYHRGKLNIDYKYTVKGEPIERAKVVKDLGVILDEKMNFHAHIEHIHAKAKSRLAWIKHFGKEFEDPWTIKTLFFAFVLPIVEYAPQIWNPHTKDGSDRIESIQKQFLLFALRKMKWPDKFIRPQYEHRLLLFQMITLNERRQIAQIKIIHGAIRGEISSQYILDKIKINMPRYQIRTTEFLTLPNRKYDYSKFEPINYMLITYNKLYNLKVPNSLNDERLIDLNVTANTVKKRIAEYFRNNRS